MKTATRRRANSKVTLLASSTKVFQKRMLGRVRWCQSGAAPCRTIKALVKAAKLMVIAASATQMPVFDGGGA